jgi:hypothetical protein
VRVTSGIGPTEKTSRLEPTSAIWGSADQIYSGLDFRPLTHSGHAPERTIDFHRPVFLMQTGSLWGILLQFQSGPKPVA